MSHGEIRKVPVWRHQKLNVVLVWFVTTTGELTHEPFRMPECEQHPMEKYEKFWRGGIRS